MEKLFSRRAMKYRQMGLHERHLTDDDLLRLMTEEYTFVTRQVIVHGDPCDGELLDEAISELID